MTLQLGTPVGVTAIGPGASGAKIAEITADGSNTFTVAANDAYKFLLNQTIRFRVKSTGALFGTTARQITGITVAGVLTYSGADITLVPGTHAVYPNISADVTTVNVPVNLNGGVSAERPFDDPAFSSLADMKARLLAIDSNAFSAANVASMTENDLIYALRVLLYSSTIN